MVGASTACEKENTADTDENLFRLMPVPGHDYPGCQRFVLRGFRSPSTSHRPASHEAGRKKPLAPRVGNGARVLPLELVPVPGDGAAKIHPFKPDVSLSFICNISGVITARLVRLDMRTFHV